jgi:micrococcal nuclease
VRRPGHRLARIQKVTMARLRFRPRPGRGTAALLALGVFLALVAPLPGQDEPAAPYPEPAGTHKWVLVERVLSGDTLYCFGGEKVRLIGAEAPSPGMPGELSEPHGKEAAEFTRGLVEGKRVRLTFGPRRRGAGNRTLAYVWLDDGRMLNLEMLLLGHAELDRWTPPCPGYVAAFRQAEEVASAAGLGLWAGKARAAAREVPRPDSPAPLGPGSTPAESLPVYLADGTVRLAREPAIFAFGRVIWRDVEADRLMAVYASEVQMERTRPIHESARERLLVEGPSARGRGASSPTPRPRPRVRPPEQRGDDRVYVTDEGKHYHRQGCRRLMGNWVAYSRDFAVKGLGLAPCPDCKP